MADKKQWALAGYFLLNAMAIVSGTFLGATGLVLLALGIYQLLRQRKASQSVS
jgi:hypothetical protein